MTSRSAVLAVLLGVAASALGGCATVGRRGVDVPLHDKLYVAVFVDESERGEVGVALADAIQLELWRRDPESLVLFFEESSVALDGTVLSVQEKPVSDGMELTVEVSARLVDRNQKVVADLGQASVTERYVVYRSPGATASARRDALVEAVQALAKQVLDRVNEAGEAAAAEAAKT